MEERIEEKRERAEQSKEELLGKLEYEIQRLQEKQEQLKERIVRHGEVLLARNPGFRLMTDMPDLEEIRERIRRMQKRLGIK